MWSCRVAALRIPVLFMSLWLGSCGFQAVTNVPLPESIRSVHIQTQDRYSPLYRELTTTLRSRGLVLTGGRQAADAVIDITNDETGERIVAVSPQNQPREYDIFYTVTYAVLLDGSKAQAASTLTTTRNYSYDEARVLGKALEEQSLRDALARDLVGRMLRRISTLDPVSQ